MKKLWMTTALLLLVGCKQGDTYKPSVEIFGDSVSLGYTRTVMDTLKEEFLVTHACASNAGCNNGSSQSVLTKLHAYLSDGDPDIITFNIGIHDISKEVNHPWLPCQPDNIRTQPSQYFENINKIFNVLQRHAKVVIWVDTTPIPYGMCVPVNAQVPYNQLAEQAARDHGFYILHLVAKDRKNGNVHFFHDGYVFLGKQVADCIETAWIGAQSQACNPN